MRTAAIVLAATTAVGQLVLFAYGEAQLDLAALGRLGGEVAPWWTRAAWALGWSLPWVVGAVVLAWGPARIGTAVVVAMAGMSLVEVAGVIRLASSVAEAGGGTSQVVGAVGVGGSWLTGAAAGLVAWLARPRGGWRSGAPGPGGLFTAAAIAAWLPTAFRSSAFAPPGAPRRIVEPYATGFDLASAEMLVHPLLVAIVLLVAPRLRRAAAGAVTLTFALPQLVSHAATLRAAVGEDLVIPTPAGVAGLAGVAVLVVVGAVWLVRGRAAVSDAATDPDQAAEG